MITATNLTKRFGRTTAVNDVSFTITPGEAVALWGENGAGKTTAMRCVLGLLSYDGQIHVDGHDVARHGKTARRSMGYVPQELALYDDLRLPDALRFFGRLKRVRRVPVDGILEEVGLAEHRRKRIRELSGGMKRRMALALALLADPPILVLDELTSNLDARAQRGFVSLVRRLKARGKTILFTSHHLDEVETLADRVLVLDAGRLRRTCDAHELAEAIDARCVLRIYVGEDALGTAVGALQARGFDAMRNGTSLHVTVPVRDKAAPLQILTRADLVVRDFEITTSATREEGTIDG